MRGIYVHLLILSVSSLYAAAQSPGYKVQFSAATSGRPQGSVLVLDVSSLWQKHPTQPQLSTPDSGECQRRCAKLPGCTAWSFCKDPKGCGSGCEAHVRQNPGVAKTALEVEVAPKRGERSDGPSVYRLPINRFGPYTPHTATKGCQPNSPDKWAFGTCSLLKDTKANSLLPAAQGAGWVSAWLTAGVPQQCAGLSAATCAAASASPDPSAALACMKDKRAASYIDAIGLISDSASVSGVGSRTLDQCLTCAQHKDKALQKQCTSCVLDRAACVICVPYPTAATQLAASAQGPCMTCVAAKGKRFAGTCLTCATSPDPTKCIKCLDSFFPKFTCRTNEYKDCYKPDFDNPCATCQKVASSNYNSCISCFSQPKSKVDCESCALVKAQSEQASCFSCSAKVPAANSEMPGGCGLCFTRSKTTAARTQCVNCLTDSGTNADKRRFCSLCSSNDLTGDQSARCFKCVEGKSGSAGCSTCSSCATSAASFDACMTCHASPVNGPDCRDCDTLGANLAPGARDALRKRCWDCVVASKLVLPPDAGSAPLGSCQACFSSTSVDTAQCVACNTNPLVPSVAKSWCSGCATKPAAARDGCIKCLTSNKLPRTYEYRDKCSI